MQDKIILAIDALASAAFIEGGVSPENTQAARDLTEQRKHELAQAISSPCLLQIQEPPTKTEALAHYSQQAILAMGEAMAVPDGWKLVPVVPTTEMGWAYLDKAREISPGDKWKFSHPGYEAALSAAPPQPAFVSAPAAAAPVVLPGPDSAVKECWSKDEEEFNSNDLGALLKKFGDELRPGHTVYRGTAHTPSFSSMVDAESVIENIGERVWDYCGEYAEGYPAVTPEHKAKLQSLLENWLRDCPSPTFWQVGDVQPYVLNAEDFTAEQLEEIALAEDDERRTAIAAQAARQGGAA